MGRAGQQMKGFDMVTEAASVCKVEEGEVLDAPMIRESFGEPVTVKPSCGGQAGRWSCVTCGYDPPNQFYKDTHIGEPGEHRMAWICLEHGIEVP